MLLLYLLSALSALSDLSAMSAVSYLLSLLSTLSDLSATFSVCCVRLRGHFPRRFVPAKRHLAARFTAWGIRLMSESKSLHRSALGFHIVRNVAIMGSGGISDDDAR